jgi:SnoaL-like domain
MTVDEAPVAGLTSASMEALIRTYFDGCNEADEAKMVACFVPEAVHYFPAGQWDGAFRGAAEIARRWADAVRRLGSVWTVDEVIADPASGRAVIEWTHFKTYENRILRGDEWYRFDAESGLITEIRAYYASPQDASRSELVLDGFDYAGRGYPLVAPIRRVR